jgi:D-cysteine desulfhydrase family pyridoxal phosphate-dependent enzyme
MESKMSANKIPRLRIAHLPTPTEPLPRLSAELGGPDLWVKRDDQTGLAFGGNKTRKLEFLLAEAQANGAQLLITRGALQSNHCRQTAAAAARHGFDCQLVLSGDAPETRTGNLLLDDLVGAEILWAAEQDPEKTLQDAFQDAWESGRRPYLIPYGGSNAVGAVAYAYAIEEFLQQDLDVTHIVFPTSSGGTQAGLIAGAHRYGFEGQIMGISVDPTAEFLAPRVIQLAQEICEHLDCELSLSHEDVYVNDDYLGEGYAVMGDLEREAIRLFARLEGLLLDPVYTGRAAGGMMDLIRKGVFDSDDRVLFWHTGGTPALFAYASELA